MRRKMYEGSKSFRSHMYDKNGLHASSSIHHHFLLLCCTLHTTKDTSRNEVSFTSSSIMDNDSRVRALLKQEGNLDCADCETSSKTAIKFCSVKLGVLLCNQCYAAHRAVGAHITWGKCIGLDEFTDAEVDLLGRLGNRRMNAQYEAMVPPGAKPPPTLCRGCSSSSCNDCCERLQYIQKKYEKKLWYSDDIRLNAPANPTRTTKHGDDPDLVRLTTASTPLPSKEDFFASFGL